MAYSTNSKGNTPTIIGVADATHYLVGVTDSGNNFSGLNHNDHAVVLSLVEAKQYLRNQNIHHAMLELHSAYDEMCGSQTSGVIRQSIEF